MLVTAVIPTHNRPDSFRRALDCVLAQEWPELEVLVIDSESHPSADERVTQANVAYLRTELRSLGEKLNLACSLAKGEYLVHFHDDDWSAPNRIADQVTRLEESGKAVTVYRNLKFVDEDRLWITRNWPGGYGMSLCHRREWGLKHPFAHCSSEDWEFVSHAMRAHRFVAGDAGDIMRVRLNHEHVKLGHGWEEIT